MGPCTQSKNAGGDLGRESDDARFLSGICPHGIFSSARWISGGGEGGASFTSFTRGSHEVARGKTPLPDRLVSRSLLYTRV